MTRQPGPGQATAPGQVIRSALDYARRGWPVFPCQPGSKEPATRHGFKDATTSPARIRLWWERNPAANLAIATGAPGPDILDVDQHGPAGNGFPAYRRLRDAGLLHGAFAVVATPGGGLHAYFPGTGQPCARLPRQHLDFKAAGGYVLAPPSVINGNPYQLIACRDITPVPLDWPAATRLLTPRQPAPAPVGRAGPGDIGALTAWIERQAEGNRNSGLFWAACRAIETGHAAQLDALAAAAARTGLADREIARTIASAHRTTHAPGPEITP